MAPSSTPGRCQGLSAAPSARGVHSYLRDAGRSTMRQLLHLKCVSYQVLCCCSSLYPCSKRQRCKGAQRSAEHARHRLQQQLGHLGRPVKWWCCPLRSCQARQLALGRVQGAKGSPSSVGLFSRVSGLKLYCKKRHRLSLRMLRRLLREELFLASPACRGAEVVFCIVLLEISNTAKRCYCMMRSSSKTRERKEKVTVFVTLPMSTLLSSPKRNSQSLGKNALGQKGARAGCCQQFSSSLWFLVGIWT